MAIKSPRRRRRERARLLVGPKFSANNAVMRRAMTAYANKFASYINSYSPIRVGVSNVKERWCVSLKEELPRKITFSTLQFWQRKQVRRSHWERIDGRRVIEACNHRRDGDVVRHLPPPQKMLKESAQAHLNRSRTEKATTSVAGGSSTIQAREKGKTPRQYLFSSRSRAGLMQSVAPRLACPTRPRGLPAPQAQWTY